MKMLKFIKERLLLCQQLSYYKKMNPPGGTAPETVKKATI